MDASASAIVHAYPFAGQPTEHRVELSGRELYAVCAVDALGVAGMFRTDTTVKSNCRACSAPIEIGTARNGKSLSDSRPAGSVVWYDLAYNQTAAASCCPAIAFFSPTSTWRNGCSTRSLSGPAAALRSMKRSKWAARCLSRCLPRPAFADRYLPVAPSGSAVAVGFDTSGRAVR